MEKVLIDSSVFIGFARKDPSAKAAMEGLQGAEIVFCDIVLAEVLAGSRNHDEYTRTLKHITHHYPILPLTSEVSEIFRAILGNKAPNSSVHISDFLIAATAIAHDCSLLTLNKKHFKGIRGLVLA